MKDSGHVLVIAVVVALILLLSVCSAGRTRYVEAGDLDSATISIALNAADDGDLILLAPGTYRENLQFEASVTIQAEEGAEVILEAADGSRPVVETPGTAIEVSLTGLTIRGGSIGVLANGESVVALSDCTITASGRGVIVRDRAAVTLVCCAIEKTRQGAIEAEDDSKLVLKDVEVSDFASDRYRWIRIEERSEARMEACSLHGCDIEFANDSHGAVLRSSLTDCGIWLDDWSTAVIRENWITDCYNAFDLDDYASATIECNTVDGARGAGLSVERCASAEGSDNLFQDVAVEMWGNVHSSLRISHGAVISDAHVVVPDDFTTLQEAIDAVAPGGTVTLNGDQEGGLIWKTVTLMGGDSASVERLCLARDVSDVVVEGVGLSRIICPGRSTAVFRAVHQERDGWFDFEIWHNASVTVEDSALGRLELFDDCEVTMSRSAVTNNDDELPGIDLYDRTQLMAIDNVFYNLAPVAVRTQDNARAEGSGNYFQGNAADMSGSFSGAFREAHVEPTQRDLVRVPEDYPTLQEAIDAVASGGTVLVEPRSYPVRKTYPDEGGYRGAKSTVGVTISKPLTLKVDSSSETALLRGETASALVTIACAAGEVVLENWRFETSRGHSPMVSISGGGRVCLRACDFTSESYAPAIHVGDSVEIELDACTFRVDGSVLELRDEASANLDKCVLSSRYADALLQVTDASSVYVTDCGLWVSGDMDGIALAGNSQGSVVACTFVTPGWTWDTRAVVALEDAAVRVEDCYVHDFTEGIVLEDRSTGDVEGNTILYCDTGVAVLDEGSVLMVDNDVLLNQTGLRSVRKLRIAGQDNRLASYLSDIARPSTAEDLPATFLDPRVGEAAEEAVALYQEGRDFGSSDYYDQAAEAYNRALSLAVGLPILQIEIRDALGWNCYELGRYEEGAERFREALALSVEIGAELTWDSAYLRNSLGLCLWRLGFFESARQLFELSLSVLERIGDREGQVALTNNLGLVAPVSIFNPGRDLEYYLEALALSEAEDNKDEAAYLYLNIGWYYHQQATSWRAQDPYLDNYRAFRSFRTALDQEVDRPAIAWRLYWGAGAALRAMGKPHFGQARAHFESAIQIVESVLGRIEAEQSKRAFLMQARDLYEDVIEFLIQIGFSSEALIYSERCRARTFLDLVAAGPIDTLEDVAEEGIRTGVVEASAIETDFAEVVAALPAGTAALEYFVTEGATYLWLIRDGSASEPIRIEIDRTSLREQVLAFRTTIEAPTTGMMDLPDETVLTVSRDLYDLLIVPVEDQLDGIEHLVIVPSGPLYYLPFCALMSCPGCEGADLLGGEYLLERFSLSYMPNLTTLKYAWGSAEEVQKSSLFLAVADPESGDEEIPRLPEAQREAEAVAGLFHPSEVYVDSEATEEIVTSRGSAADQILLSTHGSFNPLNPMFSYLLLSPTEESDGRLYTHELFGIELHADLVTLSACETLLPALEEAKDQVRAVRGADEEEDVELTEELLEALTAGDEIVGLTRAFLYAGAPSILSSLWRVVSETTEPLMVAFYRYLQQGLDKADALRQAQMDVMASYPHPRYWAAFELVGDWAGGPTTEPPDTGKLDDELNRILLEWKRAGQPSDESACMISVLVELVTTATEEVLDRFEALSERVEIQGAFGRLVQLRLPLSRLEDLVRLPEVRAVSVPPEAHTDSTSTRRLAT